jgi:hypothetical protein
MSRPLTVLDPNRLSIIIQHKRNRDKQNAQEPQQRASPINAQLPEHSARKNGKRSTEARPHKVVAGKHGRGVLWVSVWEVVENSLEEKEGADGEEGGGDDGDNPMDSGLSGP